MRVVNFLEIVKILYLLEIEVKKEYLKVNIRSKKSICL